jgi:ubiquinone biosynthesis protein COQ4
MTDLPPSIPGELALKYVELFQTGLPVCALSASVGSLMLGANERKIWEKTYLPWAIQVGKYGKKWINVYWEELFERDLIELRNELGVVVAPETQ